MQTLPDNRAFDLPQTGNDLIGSFCLDSEAGMAKDEPSPEKSILYKYFTASV
jgi:hypothetical protein